MIHSIHNFSFSHVSICYYFSRTRFSPLTLSFTFPWFVNSHTDRNTASSTKTSERACERNYRKDKDSAAIKGNKWRWTARWQWWRVQFIWLWKSTSWWSQLRGCYKRHCIALLCSTLLSSLICSSLLYSSQLSSLFCSSLLDSIGTATVLMKSRWHVQSSAFSTYSNSLLIALVPYKIFLQFAESVSCCVFALECKPTQCLLKTCFHHLP